MIYLILVTAGIGSGFMLGYWLHVSRKWLPPDFVEELGKLRHEVASLQSAVNLLQDFTNDYFISLQQSGFGEVAERAASLSNAVLLCTDLAQKGETAVAWEILHYLHFHKGRGKPPPVVYALMRDDAPNFHEWKDRCREILIKVAEELNRASQEFNQVGRVRTSARAPTSIMLGELRKVLSTAIN